jgi:hypothetical protein
VPLEEEKPNLTPVTEPEDDDDSLPEATAQPSSAAVTEEPTPETPVSAPPPLKPKHPDRLLRLAHSVGIPAAEAEQYDEATLRWLIEQERQPPAPEIQQHWRREPEPEPVDAIDWGTDADGKPLKEADYAAPVAKAIRRAHEQGKEIEGLKASLAERDQRDKRAAAQSRDQRVDSAINALSADFEPILGKGDIHTLAPAAASRREALLSHAIKLAGSGASEAQVLARLADAAKDLYGFALTPTKQPNPEMDARKEAWQRGGVGKPTAIEPKAQPKGEKLALSNLAKKLAPFNGNLIVEDDDET